jgi:hypothetical protein
MTVTSIFEDLTAGGRVGAGPARRTVGGGIVVAAGRRPSPVPRPDPEHADAFGQGCLDDTDADDGADTHTAGTCSDEADRGGADGDLGHLAEAARREAEALGHGRVGTEHLLLAVLRAGGEVGRAFGLRRAGVAVVAAACAGPPGSEPLVAPDGAPVLTEIAASTLTRARRRAAARDRAPAAADLALALLDAGRSARLLADLGVDGDDLADVLSREGLALPALPAVHADVRPRVPAPVPVGTLAPVRLMLPAPPPDPASAARRGAVTAPLRIGPPPGSPACRLGRGRIEAAARPDDGPALDLPA